jgi:hypothetical protein
MDSGPDGVHSMSTVLWPADRWSVVSRFGARIEAEDICDVDLSQSCPELSRFVQLCVQACPRGEISTGMHGQNCSLLARHMASNTGKSPASLFYWGDVARDPDLRRSSPYRSGCLVPYSLPDV